MYYQEKKTIATLASGILILVAYCIFGISKYLEIGEKALYDLKLWATVMLITIGGGVVVVIIVQIIFHIIFAIAHEVAKKKCPKREMAMEIMKHLKNLILQILKMKWIS